MKNIRRNKLYATRYTLSAILIVLLCAILPQAAQAANYYVDAVNGNDVNSGTSEAPWKTLNYDPSPFHLNVHLNVLVNGDVVLLRSGDYGDIIIGNEHITDSQLGSADWTTGVTFKPNTGAAPVIATLTIWNAKHLTFDGLVIRPPGDGTGVGVYGCSYMNFLNLDISGIWYDYYYAYPYTGASNNIAGAFFFGNYQSLINDHIVIDHCKINNVRGPIGVYSPLGVGCKITNNQIHGFCGSGIHYQPNSTASAEADKTPAGEFLVENNIISNEKLSVKYLDFTGTVTGTFQADELVTQAVPGGTAYGHIKGIYSGSIVVRVVGHTLFVPSDGNDLIGQTSGAHVISPVIHTDTAHVAAVAPEGDSYTHSGSGIAIQGHNITVRNNILHDCGAISCYQSYVSQNGYHDIKIENNLLYDIAGYYRIRVIDAGYNISIKNNTVIGYGSVLEIDPPINVTDGGSGIVVADNIFMGDWQISSGLPNLVFTNNIIYDIISGFTPVTSMPGNTIIGSIYPFVYASRNTYFESGFFKGGAAFNIYNGVTINRQYTIYGTIPNYPHGQDLSDSYMLAVGSPAIGYGSTTYQPSDSLGSIGPDGFIRDDGSARDADASQRRRL